MSSTSSVSHLSELSDRSSNRSNRSINTTTSSKSKSCTLCKSTTGVRRPDPHLVDAFAMMRFGFTVRHLVCDQCTTNLVRSMGRETAEKVNASTTSTDRTKGFTSSQPTSSQSLSDASLQPPEIPAPPMPKTKKKQWQERQSQLEAAVGRRRRDSLAEMLEQVDSRNALEAAVNVSKRRMEAEQHANASKRQKTPEAAQQNLSRPISPDDIDSLINQFRPGYSDSPVVLLRDTLVAGTSGVRKPTTAPRRPLIQYDTFSSDRDDSISLIQYETSGSDLDDSSSRPAAASTAKQPAEPLVPAAAATQTTTATVPSSASRAPTTSSRKTVNFDAALDPDDVVPAHLRQKPSQVPRMRSKTPPTRAPTYANPLDAPIHEYSRQFGG